MEQETYEPVFRVERGRPDDVELAALVAVLATLTAADTPIRAAGRQGAEVTSLWCDPAGVPETRRSPSAGPAAWRASGLPR